MKPIEHPEEYFNRDLPRVTTIEERYEEKFIDLRDTFFDNGKLTNKDVAEAIITAAKHDKGLIIPNGYKFWNRSNVCKQVYNKKHLGIDSVPLDTPIRFKRFGPEINITPSGISRAKLKNERMTPRNAFRNTFIRDDVKERLLSEAHRGWGYWGGAHHRIVPFGAVYEGHLFREYYGDDIDIKYQFADSRQDIPSRSEEDKYKTKFLVLPVTSADDEYFVEWTKMEFEHVCEDVAIRSMQTKKRSGREYENVHKYANTEMQFDAHIYGALELIEDVSGNYGKPVLVKFPRARRISPFDVLTRRTIIEDGTTLRRPIKLEIDIGLGYVLGHPDMKVEKLYDLEE